MIFSKEHKKVTIVFTILSILAVLYVVLKEPVISPDTLSFSKARVKLSAGYTSFIILFKKLFGAAIYTKVIYTQLIALLLSLWVFVKYTLLRLQLPLYQVIILIVILFYPIFDLNLSIINNVNSGVLSYCFYLLLLTLFYTYLSSSQNKYFYVLGGVLIVLITFRAQFNFVLVGLILFELFNSIKLKRWNLKRILVLLLIPIAVSVIDKSYHKYIHGAYIATPFKWISLNTSMMYVAQPSDAQYIENEEDRTYFLMVQELLTAEGLAYDNNMYGTRPEFVYSKFHHNLPTICNKTIHTAGVKYFYNEQTTIPQATLKVEQINKRLFFQLLPHNFWKWLLLWVYGVFYGLGGIVMTFLWLLAFGYLCCSWYAKKQNDPVATFLLVALAFMLLNRVLVSLSVHAITRYFFYNNWVPVAIVFMMFNRLKRNSTS